VRYKGGVRLLAYAALGFAAAALAGCGGDDNGKQATWQVDNLVDVDDAALVRDFNAYADSVDDPWERTPITVVTELLRLDSSDNPNVSVFSEASAEAAAEAVVTVTYSRLLDDSVAVLGRPASRQPTQRMPIGFLPDRPAGRPNTHQ